MIQGNYLISLAMGVGQSTSSYLWYMYLATHLSLDHWKYMWMEVRDKVKFLLSYICIQSNIEESLVMCSKTTTKQSHLSCCF